MQLSRDTIKENKEEENEIIIIMIIEKSIGIIYHKTVWYDMIWLNWMEYFVWASIN